MFSNVLYKRNVLVWWLFNSDNPSCIGRLFSINSTLRFLQCLSGHTCLQFIYSQKACFEANLMVAFLFKMVHYFRSCGLDGFGWCSIDSNSAVTRFVVLPLPRFSFRVRTAQCHISPSKIRGLPFTYWYTTELLYLVVLYSRVLVFNP